MLTPLTEAEARGLAADAASQPSRAALWLRRLGTICLAAFGLAALVNGNRMGGLLTLLPVARLAPAVGEPLVVGAAYLLPALGAVLWLSGRALLWGVQPRPRGPLFWLGPALLATPIAALMALSLLRLDPAGGPGPIAAVLAQHALFGLAYLYAANERPALRVLAGGLAAVGALHALVGVGQFALQSDLGLRWLGELPLDPAVWGTSVVGTEGNHVLRAYGLMRHPNALGALLPLGLLAAWYMGQTTRAGWRWLWLGLGGLNAVGLLVAFSRTGWVAAGAGLAAYALLTARRTAWRATPARGWWLRLLAVGAAAVGLVLLTRPALYWLRLTGASELEQTSLTERARQVAIAQALIRQAPLWGVGTRGYVAAAAALTGEAPTGDLLVHNTWLLLWAENGIGAAVAWLGLALSVGGLAWRGAGRLVGTPALPAAWAATMLVVGLFQAFYWPAPQLWQGDLLMGLALGLMAAARGPAAARGASGP